MRGNAELVPRPLIATTDDPSHAEATPELEKLGLSVAAGIGRGHARQLGHRPLNRLSTNHGEQGSD